MGFLDDKVAVICGGAGGLGRAFAAALAAEGAAIVLLDVDPAVQQAVDELQRAGASAHGFVVDATDATAAAGAVASVNAEMGRIDILVNSAGAWRQTRLDDPWDKALADFDALFDTNLKSHLVLARLCVTVMLAGGGGDVVNISSHDVLPSTEGDTNSPDTDLYNAAAWGLNGFTDSWAQALASRGIRVNALCVGPTETPMLAQMRAAGANPAKALTPGAVAGVLVDLLREGSGGRSDQNVGIWPGRPAVLGPVKARHRAIFYTD